jgi:acetylornithine deacetylase/succinyl-diaminopimelate desuccinylase-like protein
VVEKHAVIQRDKYAVQRFGGYTMYLDGRKFYLIQVAEKKNCRVEITFRGPGGHGSVPVRDSAMSKMGHALVELNKHRLPVHISPVTGRMIETIASHLPAPSSTYFNQLLDPELTDSMLEIIKEQTDNFFDPLLHNTVNAVFVKGGEMINVVPGEVTLYMDGRILPGLGADDLINEIRDIIGDASGIRITSYESGPSNTDMGLFDTLDDILRKLEPECIPVPIIISATTDARLLATLGIQTYGYLPMNLPEGFNFMKLVHAADERIPVAAMYSGADAIYQVLKRFSE